MTLTTNGGPTGNAVFERLVNQQQLGGQQGNVIGSIQGGNLLVQNVQGQQQGQQQGQVVQGGIIIGQGQVLQQQQQGGGGGSGGGGGQQQQVSWV